MDIHDNTFTIFELEDILYEIAKTSGGEIAFKHGPVKRLFITSECREAVIEMRSGEIDYALDSDPVNMYMAIEAFETEYPEEYAALMKQRETVFHEEFTLLKPDFIPNDKDGGYLSN